MRTGERLRLARDRLRMTQKDLAGEDFHRSLISQIETGLIEPSLNTLTVLADRLQLPVAFFVETDAERERAKSALQRSASLQTEGRFEKAYDLILDALVTVSSFPLRASLLVEAGELLRKAERAPEAITHLRVAERYLRLGDDPTQLAVALRSLGYALTDLGRYEEANEALEESLWILEHAVVPESRKERRANREAQVGIALCIGRNCARLNENERAIEWLERATDLATDLGRYFDMARGHQAIALVNFAKGDEADARYHNNIALSLFEEPEHGPERAVSVTFEAHLASLSGDFAAAHHLFDEAQRLTQDRLEAHILTLQGLALNALSLRQYDQAAEWSEKCLNMLPKQSRWSPLTLRQSRFLSVINLLARVAGTTPQTEWDELLEQERSWYQDEGFTHSAWQTLDR